MSRDVVESFSPKLMSASAQVAGVSTAAGGKLSGIFVSSSSAGTITVYDATTASAPDKIVDTFSVSAGAFYPLPFKLTKGLYIAIGGTATITVAYESN